MKVYKKRLAGTICAVGLCITSVSWPALAQTRSNVRQGLPGRRISGGTRGECASTQPVVALDAVEENSSADSSANKHFAVDFQLPGFDNTYPVEFNLRDWQGNTVYTESLQTNSEEKLVSIQIPKESVQEDRDYQWYFSVVCDAQDRSQNIVLSGQLQQQRVETSSTQEEIEIESTVARSTIR